MSSGHLRDPRLTVSAKKAQQQFIINPYIRALCLLCPRTITFVFVIFIHHSLTVTFFKILHTEKRYMQVCWQKISIKECFNSKPSLSLYHHFLPKKLTDLRRFFSSTNRMLLTMLKAVFRIRITYTMMKHFYQFQFVSIAKK